MSDGQLFEIPMSKLDEAKDILRQLGMPVAQQGDRSGHVLLALACVNPEQSWNDATNPQLGVTPIMLWIGDVYGKVYAVGSRETIRRQTLHQFMAAGVCLYDPDIPLATNSSLHVYQLPSELIAVLRTYGTPDWETALECWHAAVPAT